MTARDPTIGDGLLELLGRPLDAPEVQASLDRFARGVQAVLGHDMETWAYEMTTNPRRIIDHGRG